jgi:hypothetical protein
MKKQFNFSPWWLTGFTQADGGFMIIIKKSPRGRFKYRFYPVFEISQGMHEFDIITSLHKHLGSGRLISNVNRLSIVFTSMNDLLTIVLPHFDKYPLRGGKLASYLIFRKVILAMSDGVHLHKEGFLGILELCYFINSTSTRTLETKQEIERVVKSQENVTKMNTVTTPHLESVDFSSVKTQEPMVYDFVAGLFDGDGSIGFSFSTTGTRVRPYVSVTIGIHDYSVLLELVDFFGCGSVTTVNNKQAAVYSVRNTADILNRIENVLKSITMNTETKGDALRAAFDVWNLLSIEGIKSNENLERVVNIVYNNNRGGRSRKISKDTYLTIARFIKL